jgi:hypothetical protein
MFIAPLTRKVSPECVHLCCHGNTQRGPRTVEEFCSPVRKNGESSGYCVEMRNIVTSLLILITLSKEDDVEDGNNTVALI